MLGRSGVTAMSGDSHALSVKRLCYRFTSEGGQIIGWVG